MRLTRILLTVLFVFLFGCTDRPTAIDQKSNDQIVQATLPSNEIKPLATPTPLDQPLAAPEKLNVNNNKLWLAEAKEKNNKVDFRLHNESVWQALKIGSTFDRYDALQTHTNSQAAVVYKSGTRLDVRENTLLVFDHDPGLQKKIKEDRVIVKTGALAGSTQTELWVFTNAGLVQIKANEKKKRANAQVIINKDNKLNVKVTSGQANLILQKESQFQKIEIAAQSEIEIIGKQNFVSADVNVDEKKISEISNAVGQIKNPTKAELVIDTPKEDITTIEKSFEVKGHLTSEGAKLILNGELVALNSDLTFAKKIELSPGLNLLVLQLIRSDASVQFTRKTIKLNNDQ